MPVLRAGVAEARQEAPSAVAGASCPPPLILRPRLVARGPAPSPRLTLTQTLTLTLTLTLTTQVLYRAEDGTVQRWIARSAFGRGDDGALFERLLEEAAVAQAEAEANAAAARADAAEAARQDTARAEAAAGWAARWKPVLAVPVDTGPSEEVLAERAARARRQALRAWRAWIEAAAAMTATAVAAVREAAAVRALAKAWALRATRAEEALAARRAAGEAMEAATGAQVRVWAACIHRGAPRAAMAAGAAAEVEVEVEALLRTLVDTVLLGPENEELTHLRQAEHEAIKGRDAADAAAQAAHEAVLYACGCPPESAGLRTCMRCRPDNLGPLPARASRSGVREVLVANAMRPRAAPKAAPRPRHALRALYANPYAPPPRALAPSRPRAPDPMPLLKPPKPGLPLCLSSGPAPAPRSLFSTAPPQTPVTTRLVTLAGVCVTFLPSLPR